MTRVITTPFPEPGSDRDAAAWAGSSVEAGRCYAEGTSYFFYIYEINFSFLHILQ